MKRLDKCLENVRNGRYAPADFIIADAKDADMGFGRAAPGPRADSSGLKTRDEYLQAMREMTESGLVDIMLMSASSAESLTRAGVFENSPVTPAVRLNDATDIWGVRGGAYTGQPSLPFATARPERAREIADLGLYSVTFTNDTARDRESLERYRAFREAADAVGLRHFLEVFNPNVDTGIAAEDMGAYVNDCIVRALAGVTDRERPLFLKMVYNGPRALEELAGFDPKKLIVGILGGSAGTTRDTLELVGRAARHGARVALFGRKINLSEAPLELVRLMRAVVEGQTTPEDGVRAYHDALQQAGIRPQRPPEDDLRITEGILHQD